MATVRLKTVSVRMEPKQWEALRREALQRAVKQGGRVDASAIVRELVTRWMEGKRP